jgi:hypothetical protein
MTPSALNFRRRNYINDGAQGLAVHDPTALHRYHLSRLDIHDRKQATPLDVALTLLHFVTKPTAHTAAPDVLNIFFLSLPEAYNEGSKMADLRPMTSLIERLLSGKLNLISRMAPERPFAEPVGTSAKCPNPPVIKGV